MVVAKTKAKVTIGKPAMSSLAANRVQGLRLPGLPVAKAASPPGTSDCAGAIHEDDSVLDSSDNSDCRPGAVEGVDLIFGPASCVDGKEVHCVNVRTGRRLVLDCSSAEIFDGIGRADFDGITAPAPQQHLWLTPHGHLREQRKDPSIPVRVYRVSFQMYSRRKGAEESPVQAVAFTIRFNRTMLPKDVVPKIGTVSATLLGLLFN